MGKRDNRPAVERRIGKALRYWEEGNMEDALFEIAPTIDVVAKKKVSRNETGRRACQGLHL